MKTISVTFEQVASALEAHAAKCHVITYNDFADEVGLPRPNNLFANSALKAYFDQIDWDDAKEHRPFRTALVVQKTSGRPGAGFYKSLKHFRAASEPESSQEKIWQNEIANLYDYYEPGQSTTKLQVELSRAQSTRLKALCARSERSPELLLQSNFTHLLAFLESEFAIIEQAEDEITRGEVFTHEEVIAHLQQMLKEKA